MSTKIEWTDETWNPIRGCSRVSEGCRNCYAESTAQRFSGPGGAYEGLVRIENGRRKGWSGAIKFVEEHLLDPLRWNRPRRIFVNSMSDLFHENVTDEMRDRIFAVMALSPQHTFQVLTKRPERMLAYLKQLLHTHEVTRIAIKAGTMVALGPSTPWWLRNFACQPGFDTARVIPPLDNVWLGVSVENQAAADERIPLLLQTPAAVRFLSCEPLLGPVDLTKVMDRRKAKGLQINAVEAKDANPAHEYLVQVLGPGYPHARLDWVICGGESGAGARPMHPDWARSLRDQCVAAGVPFFFKQWGEWVPWQADGGFSEWKSQAGKLMDRHGFPDFKDSDVKGWTADLLLAGNENAVHQRVGKKAAGRQLDGREWSEFPEVKA
jgi:protein gp37